MKKVLALSLLVGMALLVGCAQKPVEPPTDAMPPEPMPAEPAASAEVAVDPNLSGEIKIDGSSTVYPITEAVAEEFGKLAANVHVTVGISGTGGGFKKFTAGETDISDASRPIKDKEMVAAQTGGIEFIELPVAYDGLAVMVNPANTFVDHLTVDELKKIWEPGSTIKKWSEVRAGWPEEELHLYGPDTDSGTFDYFTEAICGKEGECRSDYTPSTDDNVLVTGIAGDQGALGYFGFAYYAENQDKLKLVPVDGGQGPVAPSDTTINDGSYQPLSRPIFIYVKKAAAERPEVDTFVKYYLTKVAGLLKEVGYTALPQAAYDAGLKRYTDRVTGSVFSGGSQPGVKIEDLLAKESAPAAPAPTTP